MPDLYHPDPVASRDATLLDMLDVRPSEHTPDKTRTLCDMGTKVAPELAKRRAALDSNVKYEQNLGQVANELEARLKQAKEDCARLRIECCDELIGLGSASDAVALAGRLRPVDDQAALIADALDLLRYRRIPAARLARLEAALELARAEELAGSIAAALAHSQMLDKLIVAGVFDGGRVGIVSEEVEALRATAKEYTRRVGLSEEDLRSERQRQQSDFQARSATGMITKAEVAASIPALRG